MDELLLLMKLLNKESEMLKQLEEKELHEEVKTKEVKQEPADPSNEHFNEPFAKHIVSNMYHYYDGCKCIGEIFDMNVAKTVHQRYKDCLDSKITCSDIYVAINAQYHDYSTIFKEWYTGDIDDKIIESAIAFWFKDDDYKKGFKLWNYFCM